MNAFSWLTLAAGIGGSAHRGEDVNLDRLSDGGTHGDRCALTVVVGRHRQGRVDALALDRDLHGRRAEVDSSTGRSSPPPCLDAEGAVRVCDQIGPGRRLGRLSSSGAGARNDRRGGADDSGLARGVTLAIGQRRTDGAEGGSCRRLLPCLVSGLEVDEARYVVPAAPVMVIERGGRRSVGLGDAQLDLIGDRRRHAEADFGAGTTAVGVGAVGRLVAWTSAPVMGELIAPPRRTAGGGDGGECLVDPRQGGASRRAPR